MSPATKIEYPLKWKEKLENMKVGDFLPVEVPNSVYVAISRNFSESEKEFKIRKVKETDSHGVWRLK